MQHKIKVKIVIKPVQHGLEFDVIFPDHTIKAYKFDDYEVASYRMSIRNFIEYQIELFYQEYYNVTPNLELIFY